VKRLIFGLYIAFALLMAATFYVAGVGYEGLVEPNYYERSKDFFRTKESEEAIGLAITVPETLATGNSRFSAGIRTAEGALSGALVALYIGDVRTTDSDMRYELKEASPGVYASDIEVPYRGTWILRLEVKHEMINTERRWSVKAW
jgi:nitrogen fixation protein FixH